MQLPNVGLFYFSFFYTAIMVISMYFQRQPIVQAYRAIDNVILVDFKAGDCSEPQEADVITHRTLS